MATPGFLDPKTYTAMATLLANFRLCQDLVITFSHVDRTRCEGPGKEYSLKFWKDWSNGQLPDQRVSLSLLFVTW
jgi:hypothetical protein